MIELTGHALEKLPDNVERRAYDRSQVTAGIVHLSVSNFHRAHQAWYIDQLLALPGNEGWGICGVGIIDDEMERLKADILPAQDNLYTLSLVAPDGETTHQVIGSIVDYLFAPSGPEEVLARLASPATHIVSLTITEGGYNMDRLGNYQLDMPAVAAEIADPAHPSSAFGYIVEGLRRRRDAGLPPFTVLSCDNLMNNGEVARRAVLSHAGAADPALASWIMEHGAFPNSMVDRITPAVKDEEAARLNASSGVIDRLPVRSESFAQWVVEDKFCDGRPALELVGAQLVENVHHYELAKLRMLNGSHAMLAYPAQLAGLQTVDEALREPLFQKLLDSFMTEDVIAHLAQPPGMDLHEYKAQVLERFSNPAISDRLPRISADGAAKLPVFLGGTYAAVLRRGEEHQRLAFLLACFVRYLRGAGDHGSRFNPREPNLTEADFILALSGDRRDALRMSMLTGFGIEPEGPFADSFLHYSAALEHDGTLTVLARMLDELEKAGTAAPGSDHPAQSWRARLQDLIMCSGAGLMPGTA